MSNPVITRFAPSPTGYLHIGGARTALFNWLFAKANGGEMLLRIEDTDRSRSSDEAVTAILDGLTWLGLDWKGEPISQFSRVARHREVADAMVASGTAYRCTCTPQEVEAMREKARAAGKPPRYDGTCRNKPDNFDTEGKPFVIRLKAPQDGATVVDDQVQGKVQFPNSDLDDLVLVRSDGNPTYMLAVVVDDYDMGVTHIIRGDDHLTNAARQILIYQGMNWEVPVMAHIPLIHGADGTKLSKRHGAIGAEVYRSMGYLPQALRNYLVRLGWAHGDDEIISTDQMLEWFGFDGMNKSAARFDFAKLEALNAHYMREMDRSKLLEEFECILPEIEGGTAIAKLLTGEIRKIFLRALPSLTERSKTLVELEQSARFIFAQPPIRLDEKAASLLDEDGRRVVAEILPRLETLAQWDHESIAALIKAFVEERDTKMGKVAQPIRAALTGMATSPGAFDVLVILGKEKAISRLKNIP